MNTVPCKQNLNFSFFMQTVSLGIYSRLSLTHLFELHDNIDVVYLPIPRCVCPSTPACYTHVMYIYICMHVYVCVHICLYVYVYTEAAPMIMVLKLTFLRILSWALPIKDPNRSSPNRSSRLMHIYQLTNKIKVIRTIYPCIGWFFFFL